MDTPIISSIYDDIYCNKADGLAEKNYVFIDGNNLNQRFTTNCNFTIGELGFGLGLNFFATLNSWTKHSTNGWLHYYSVEKHPLNTKQLSEALDYYLNQHHAIDHFVDQYQTFTRGHNQCHFKQERCTLHLIIDDADTIDKHMEHHSNAWFLDGFAPRKNRAMWSAPLMKKLASLSAPHATIASYSVAAMVRENVTQAGFIVEKKTGFGNKRHMLTGAIKTS